MKEDLLNEMDLPLTNPNEELETISRNKFKPLFDITLFEIRSEDYRDKGIDFHIEIKKSKKYTNFRFAIQLKATDVKDFNNDGSISVQINTSNINYLLNFGMPSFYVLYLSKLDAFFYEDLNDFLMDLSEKDPQWYSQSTHVLRFSKRLSQEGIKLMYDTVLKKGIFQREINEKLALQTNIVNKGDRLTIDPDLSISDDKEIRELIENLGLYLINETRWTEIILLHKKTSRSIVSTAKYNLVLGIAYYYNSQLFEALLFLSAASKQNKELPNDLIIHLSYFEATVKFSIGLISQEQYSAQLNEFEKETSIGLYIKLEKAKQMYIDALDKNSPNCYEEFVAKVNNLINDRDANKSFTLFAKCELILHEGSRNNMDYVREIALINGIEEKSGPSLMLRLEFARAFIQKNKQWADNATSLKKEAFESNNHLAFYNALINEVRVYYEFHSFASNITIEKELPGYPKQELPSSEDFLNDMLQRINKATDYYTKVGHTENILISLSLKYEILHFLNQITSADEILKEIENIIVAYDLEQQRKKLQFLKDEGPTHIRFKKWMEEARNNSKSDKLLYDKMVSEMGEMDASENSNIIKTEGQIDIIQLFPIGFFQFPKSELQNVLLILNANSDELISTIKNFLDNGIIPVINIYSNIITEEGYKNGHYEDKGIDSWKNIFRIRKAFYDHKYYRFNKI